MRDVAPAGDPKTGEPLEWLMTQKADLGVNKTVDFVFSNRPAAAFAVERLPARAEAVARYQSVSDHAAVIARLRLARK